MKPLAQITKLLLVVVMLTACSKNELNEIGIDTRDGQHKSAALGEFPNSGYKPFSKLGMSRLYYQGQLYNLLFKQLRDDAPETPRDLTSDQLFIYDRANNTGNQMLPVARQMAAHGESVVLEAVVIKFRAGVAPRQFYSAAEVYTASRGIQPEITLEPTGVFFRGSTFGNAAQTTGDISGGG
jgi:hypothetical protein